jgi:RNA recognition motif-containing protein
MNIFVGNLSRDVTEEDLRGAFGEYGAVEKVNILKDKFSGEPRGFGFVEMPSKAEAEAAISGLNRKDLKGRALTVNEARPKTERSGGGGGGARGFGGGGGGGGGRGGFGGGRGGRGGGGGGYGGGRGGGAGGGRGNSW